MRTGVRIGVDVGSVRIGVARSDATGTLAVPVTTVPRGPGDVAKITELVQEYDALEILVGLPLGLKGKDGKAANIAREFARELAVSVSPKLVKLVDERLTTVQAQQGLTQAGRSTRQSRSVVDQAAAVIIVQHVLDAEQTNGVELGTTVGIE